MKWKVDLMRFSRYKRYKKSFFFCGMLFLPLAVSALEAVDDEELALVNGQEGVTFGIGSSGVGSNSGNVEWRVREPVLGAAYQASMNWKGPMVEPVNTAGAVTGKLNVNYRWDVGGDIGNNEAGIALYSTWDRTRWRWFGLSHSSDASKSLGEQAWSSTGSFAFFKPWSSTISNNAVWRWQGSNSDWFYAQNGAELVFSDGSFNLGFGGSTGAGIFRIDKTDGLIWQANRFDTQWDGIWGYRPNPGANVFRTDSNYSKAMYYGLSGYMDNFRMRLGSGGISLPSGASNVLSSGLNGLLDADLTSFGWGFGGVSAVPSRLSFGTFAPVPGWLSAGQRQLSLPFYIDVLNANQGPKVVGEAVSGLCYGANANGSTGCTGAGSFFIPSEPDAGAFAWFVRNGWLAAYPTRVSWLDNAATTVYRWGVMLATEDLDANVYIYPGGNGSNVGMRVDALLLAQDRSAADGQKGTHFAVVDTAPGGNVANPAQYVGITSSKFLFNANDLYVKLARSAADGGTDAASGLRLTSTDLRFKLDGMLTAGYVSSIPTTSNTANGTRVAGISIDLFSSTDLYLTAPPAGQDYLGFQGQAILKDGSGTDKSYVSLSEPARPDVALTFNQLRGQIDISGGQFLVVPAASGGPRLEISETLGFSASNPLRVDQLNLGSNTLGRIALPGGQLYSSVSLMPQ